MFYYFIKLLLFFLKTPVRLEAIYRLEIQMSNLTECISP